MTNYSRIYFVVVSSLCFFMVSWIFYFPATFWLGFETQDAGSISRHPHLKYKGQFLIVMVHHIPAGLWSLLAPLQFCTPLRKAYPKIHRGVGYLFFATVPFITLGALLIFSWDMNLEFGTSELGLSPIKESGWVLTLYLKGLSLYFIISALVALKKVREKKFDEHFRYVCRHIASGIWVAILRVYTMFRAPNTMESVKASFYDGTLIAVFLSLVFSEVYLYLNRTTKKQKAP